MQFRGAQKIMEFLKGTISTFVIIISLAFFSHLPFRQRVISEKSSLLQINGIPIQDIKYVEIIQEPIPYVILNADKTLLTMSKSDYLKVRDTILSYNIIEIKEFKNEMSVQ